MNKPEIKTGDRKPEIYMGYLLITGVTLSAVIVIAGAIVFLSKYGLLKPVYSFFKGEPARLEHVKGIFSEALKFHGRGLIQLGVIVLIATPVARVIFALISFTLQKDYVYTVISLIVLVILIFSLLGVSL